MLQSCSAPQAYLVRKLQSKKLAFAERLPLAQSESGDREATCGTEK